MKMESMTQMMKLKTVSSLVCMVKTLENQRTTIDLQNESSVCGLVKEVDCDMNVTMSDAIVTDPNGNRYACSNYYLKSRMIRYVHLFRQVDAFEAMKKVIRKVYPPRVKKSQTTSLKKKKTVAKQEMLKREVQQKIKNRTKKS